MTQEEEDVVIATLSDYLDGTLPEVDRSKVEAKLGNDEDYKRILGELKDMRKPDEISAVLKARVAPADDFNAKVENTIHQRSAGRFFARKTFGDRVPFSAVLVIAVLGLAIIAYVLWSSQTGSLKMDKRGGETKGSSEIVPKP